MPASPSARASVNPVGPASYATRVGPGKETQNSTTSLVLPDSRRARSSPDSRSTVTATAFAACTSNPAQLRTCAMVGTPMIAVGAQATPGRSTRAPHARVPTLTPPTRRQRTAIHTAWLCARRAGVLAGISCGAALWAALQVAARPQGRPPRRVPHPGGEVPDDQDHPVAFLLELPQLAERHRVPEVDVRGGRVDPELHPHPPSLLARLREALLQASLGQALHGRPSKPRRLIDDVRWLGHRGPMVDSRPPWSQSHRPPAAGHA